MLVKGNQWKHLWQQQLLDGTMGKLKAMGEGLLGKNDLRYDLHRITKERNESNLAML